MGLTEVHFQFLFSDFSRTRLQCLFHNKIMNWLINTFRHPLFDKKNKLVEADSDIMNTVMKLTYIMKEVSKQMKTETIRSSSQMNSEQEQLYISWLNCLFSC